MAATTSAPNSPSNTMQPFGYDPSQYITYASNLAQDFANKGGTQYQWATDQFNKNQAMGDLISKSAMNSGDIFTNAANAGVSRYESMYPDAMKQQLDYAKDYASPENLALYRGQSMAGVGQAFDAQAKASADSLRLSGIDPAQIEARMDTGVRTQRAAAEAGAGTQSDINNKLIGQQLLGQAIQTGQNDAGVTQGMAGIGAADRNQAINTGLATTASGSATMGTPLQWSGAGALEAQQWPKASLDAMTASNQQGSLWNSINQTNLQAQNQANQTGSGWGALLGGALGAASNMIKFAPIALGNDGMVAGDAYAGGGQAIDTGQGQVVPPEASNPNIPGPDKVPAMLESGEGIIPKDVMQFIGRQGFQKFLDQSYKAMGMGKQPPAQGKPASPEVQQQAMQTGPAFASQGAQRAAPFPSRMGA